MEIKLFLIVFVAALSHRTQALECWNRGDSHNYKGTVSVTNTGKTCQAWTSNSPHSHANNKDNLFPQDGTVAAAKNYCRDPDKEGKPWCYTTDPKSRWEFCNVLICNEECWIDSTLYKGTKAVTKNGKQCQEWAKQTPHKHTRNKPEQFPKDASVEAAKNYCRDPDKEGQPWCYTIDPKVRWEVCGVPKC